MPLVQRSLVLVALLLACVSGDPQGSESDHDEDVDQRQLLLDFKAGISNWDAVAASRRLAGWSPCTLGGECVPVCRWGGILCDPYEYPAANQVTTLDLGCSEAGCEVAMQGVLSASLASLPHLQTLDLVNNNLSGTLPPEWGLPGAFHDLQILRLNGNRFSGRIPEQWAVGPAFLRLVDFQLAGNLLTGPFPAVAYTNTSFMLMQAFNIGNNQMTGPLPEFWNGLIILSLVSIANNRFTGTLPPDWGRQGYFFNGTYNDTQALQFLYLHGNQLTGGLPAAWAGAESFSVLRELTLSENLLGGTLPMEWGLGPDAMPALRAVNLSLTGLTGTLPEQWGAYGGLASLERLNVAGNNLSGAVPASWSQQLPSLQRVTLQPGNPGLCTEEPAGASFRLCSEGDVMCYRALVTSTNASACSNSSGEFYSGSGNSTSDSGSGSSFPVVAVAVPLAVVGTVLLALAAFLLWRRRQKQQARQAALALPQQRQLTQRTSMPSKPPSELQEELSLAIGSVLPDGKAPPPPPPFGAAPAGTAAAAAPAAVVPLEASSRPRSFATGVFCLPCAGRRSTDGGTQLEGLPSNKTAASANARNSLHIWLPQAASGAGSSARPSPTPGSGGRQAQTPDQQQAAVELSPLQQYQQQQAQQPVALSPMAQYQQQAAQFYSAPLSPMAQYEQQQAQFYSAPLMPSSHLPRQSPQLQHSSSGRSGRSGGHSSGGPPGSLPRGHSLGHDSSGAPVSGGSGGGIGAATGAAYHSSFGPRELEVLMRDWDIPAESIHICKRPDGSDWRIGSGGFGTVFKAMRNGVQPVAVKVIMGGMSDAQNMMSDEDFAREVSILRTCRDTNILQFQGVCFQPNRTLLVTEYMEGGNLAGNLRAKTVSWYRRGKKVAIDVARALVYLHSRRILHLDIKSANVLLTRDGTAKVGDVGMAKIMAGEYVSGTVGTLAWSAPELLLGQRCDAKADVYSFGVLLWEIVSGEVPIRGQLRDPIVPDECPPEVSALIDRCLSHDPSERPTSTELVEQLQRCPAVAPGGAASLPRRSPNPGLASAASGGFGLLGTLPLRGVDSAASLAPSPASRAASLDGGAPPLRTASASSGGGLPPLPEQAPAGEQEAQAPASGGSSVDMRGPFAAVQHLMRQFSGPQADGPQSGAAAAPSDPASGAAGAGPVGEGAPGTGRPLGRPPRQPSTD